MKRHVLLVVSMAACSALADGFSIQQTSVVNTNSGMRDTVITVSGTDTNHVYGVYRYVSAPDSKALVSTNFVGTSGSAYLIYDSQPLSAPQNFYIGVQEPGFVIWTTPGYTGPAGTTGCPGSYIGYGNYTLPSPAWGWVPDSLFVHTATDPTGRINSRIEYSGSNGDEGCDIVSVALPVSPLSDKYRFTVFFPNNFPSGAYPLWLKGFLSAL